MLCAAKGFAMSGPSWLEYGTKSDAEGRQAFGASLRRGFALLGSAGRRRTSSSGWFGTLMTIVPAFAVASGRILVTHNRRHFLRLHRPEGRERQLRQLGLRGQMLKIAGNSRGAWHLARTGSLQTALSNATLRRHGFLMPSDLAGIQYRGFQPPDAENRTSGGVGG